MCSLGSEIQPAVQTTMNSSIKLSLRSVSELKVGRIINSKRLQKLKIFVEWVVFEDSLIALLTEPLLHSFLRKPLLIGGKG